MDNKHDDSFDALVNVMKRKPRPLALLGAGTSVDSGYPDWSRLLAMLEEEAHGMISPKYQSFLRSLNDPAWQAEEYRRLIGENAFKVVIANQFGSKGKVGRILHTIVRLKFRHILTTNYDSCIEEAYKIAGSKIQVVDWTEEQNMRRFFLDLSCDGVIPYVVYLHGRYYDAANVVLTESSYASRYVRSDDAQRKLFAILITQPVIFIGFSVNDPDLNHLMREVNARLGAGTPQHFALTGYEVDEQRQLIKNRFQGKYGIQPVFYRIVRATDGSENHSDLLNLLERLYSNVYDEPLIRSEIPVESAQGKEGTRSIGATAQKSHDPKSALTSTPPYDPLDQQKGRWGGESEDKQRRLKAEKIKDHQVYCSFDLVVEPVDESAPPLEGEVVFHLHQTFNPSTQMIKVEDGKAHLDIKAFGAFTVGAVADGGNTKLELDLSRDDNFPPWFRES